jgi:hypothetical protein
MASQEQEQQDAREDVPTIGREGEMQSRHDHVLGKKKKKKSSRVLRHPVVDARKEMRH